MSVFSDRFTIFHQFDCSVALRDLSRLLHGQPRLHFRLHKAALAQLKIRVVVELFMQDGACLGIYLYGLQASNVLRHEPFNGKNGDFLSCSSV